MSVFYFIAYEIESEIKSDPVENPMKLKIKGSVVLEIPEDVLPTYAHTKAINMVKTNHMDRLRKERYIVEEENVTVLITAMNTL